MAYKLLQIFGSGVFLLFSLVVGAGLVYLGINIGEGNPVLGGGVAWGGIMGAMIICAVNFLAQSELEKEGKKDNLPISIPLTAGKLMLDIILAVHLTFALLAGVLNSLRPHQIILYAAIGLAALAAKNAVLFLIALNRIKKSKSTRIDSNQEYLNPTPEVNSY